MTRSHDWYEAVAGAIALGEAGAAERAEFDAHAARCARCAADAAFPDVAARIGAACDDETWRPAVDRLVAGRIRDARARRSSRTLHAFGWAIAASIVLNVAVGSGLASRLARSMRDAPDAPSNVIATRLEIVHRPKHALATAPQPSTSRSASIARRAAPRRRAVVVVAQASHVPAPPESVAVPDVLAGLDVAPHANRPRAVALELSARCDHGASELDTPPSCDAPPLDAARP